MNHNQSIVVFTFSVVTFLCGTLGLVLLCFGTIGIPASIFAKEQINFLVQENLEPHFSPEQWRCGWDHSYCDR